MVWCTEPDDDVEALKNSDTEMDSLADESIPVIVIKSTIVALVAMLGCFIATSAEKYCVDTWLPEQIISCH